MPSPPTCSAAPISPLEDLNRAESPCKKAVALDPNNGRYHRWLGHVYGEKAARANFLSAAGLAGKTRQELERAVELSPHDVDSRVDLAEFYLEAPGIVGGGHDKARAQAKILGTTDRPFSSTGSTPASPKKQ